MSKNKKNKQSYEEFKKTMHRILFRASVAIVVCIIVFTVLVIVDSIQKYVRDKNSSEDTSISSYTEEFRAYDVEGLSDEEIEKLLEIERQKRRENN